MSSEQEVLVVVSKVKNYIKDKAGMNTSSSVASKLSEIVATVCNDAIEKAKADNRKTVMDRDFSSL